VWRLRLLLGLDVSAHHDVATRGCRALFLHCTFLLLSYGLYGGRRRRGGYWHFWFYHCGRRGGYLHYHRCCCWYFWHYHFDGL
jgi:hypothetical protein